MTQTLRATFYYYNNEGLKTAQINAEGYLTTYEYDDFCRLTEQTEFAERSQGANPELFNRPKRSSEDRTMQFAYDSLGQLTSKTLKNASYQRLSNSGSRYETSTGDLTSSYRYDAMGNLLSTTDAQGNTVYSYYNEAGQLIAKTGALIKAGRGLTTYAYDALGNLVEVRRWAKGVTQANESHFTLAGASEQDIITHDVYDAMGHVIQQTDGTGHQINYSYDANGNVARQWQTLRQIDNTTMIQDKRYTYDAENRLLQTATNKNNTSYTTEDARYNAFGDIVAKGRDGHFVKHIDYDKAGRVWRSNLQGYYQIYVYDLTDKVTQVVTAANTPGAEIGDLGVDLSKSTYDDAISFARQNFYYDLQRQDNVYDNLGRVVAQIKDGSNSAADREKNNPLKRSRQDNTLDCWGNVTSHKNANGYTTFYEYNKLDQVLKQKLPEINAVDEHGRASLLSPELYFAYDELGRAIAMTDANGNTVAKILDAEGHVIQEIDAKGQHRDKNYNLLGQQESSINERGNITHYTYDKANRLVSVLSNKLKQEYLYDGAGELIQQTDGQVLP